MFMKVGAAMMLLSLVLAAGVAVLVGLWSESPETAVLSSAEPQISEASPEQRKRDSVEKPEVEGELREEQPRRKDDLREKQPRRKDELRERQPRREDSASGAEKIETSTTPTPTADWPEPEAGELARLDEPRYFEAVSNADMTLTVEALGLYDVPVESSNGEQALEAGAAHVPGTSFPWDGGAQRNVYIAGHYLGYPGTGSRLIFYKLNELQSGDEITLETSEGRSYKYQVSEMFEVLPNDYWVMDQVRNRDIVTLQTCIPPNFGKRLIVRADRV